MAVYKTLFVFVLAVYSCNTDLYQKQSRKLHNRSVTRRVTLESRNSCSVPVCEKKTFFELCSSNSYSVSVKTVN